MKVHENGDPAEVQLRVEVDGRPEGLVVVVMRVWVEVRFWYGLGVEDSEDPRDDGKDGRVGREGSQQCGVEAASEDGRTFTSVALDRAVPEAGVPAWARHAVHLQPGLDHVARVRHHPREDPRESTGGHEVDGPSGATAHQLLVAGEVDAERGGVSKHRRPQAPEDAPKALGPQQLPQAVQGTRVRTATALSLHLQPGLCELDGTADNALHRAGQETAGAVRPRGVSELFLGVAVDAEHDGVHHGHSCHGRRHAAEQALCLFCAYDASKAVDAPSVLRR